MNPNEVIILNKEEYAKEVPALLEFNQICRLCMVVITETESLKSIHDEHFNMSIKSLLEIYTLLKIPDKEEDDRLPLNICLDCANFLIEMHTFRSRCQVSNDILQKVWKKRRQEEDIPLQLEKQTAEAISVQISDIKMGTSQCPDCTTGLDENSFFTHQCKPKRVQAKAKIKYINCAICKKLIRHHNMRRHVELHMGKKRIKEHKCNLCNYRTEYSNNLNRHMMQHTGDKRFTCSKCPRGFIQLASLKAHEISHMGLAKPKRGRKKNPAGENAHKSYNCKYCPKKFRGSTDVILHERIHTGDKRYVCETCGKRFTQNTHLTYHLLTHSGEKRYVCEFCGQAFALNGNLTVHKRIHTGETPYKCLVCNKGYRDSSNRKKHQESHSQEELQQASAKLNG